MALRELVDRADGRLDYSAQVDDLERYEVIEGIVVPAPARHPRHQWLSARLSAALLPVVGEQWAVLAAPVDWELAPDRVRQLDLVVVSLEQVELPRLTEPPLLAVEILGPDSEERDLVLKARAYAAAGLKHYWVVRIGNDAPGELYPYERVGAALVRRPALVGDSVSMTEPFAVTVPLR